MAQTHQLVCDRRHTTRMRQQLAIAKPKRADPNAEVPPFARSVLTGTQPFIPRVAGSVLIKEGSMSYIVLAILSIELVPIL